MADSSNPSGSNSPSSTRPDSPVSRSSSPTTTISQHQEKRSRASSPSFPEFLSSPATANDVSITDAVLVYSRALQTPSVRFDTSGQSGPSSPSASAYVQTADNLPNVSPRIGLRERDFSRTGLPADDSAYPCTSDPLPAASATNSTLAQDKCESFQLERHPGISGWVFAGAHAHRVAEERGDHEALNAQMSAERRRISSRESDFDQNPPRDSIERTRIIDALHRHSVWSGEEVPIPRTIVRVQLEDEEGEEDQPGTGNRVYQPSMRFRPFLLLLMGSSHVAALPIILRPTNNNNLSQPLWPLAFAERSAVLRISPQGHDPLILEPWWQRNHWRRWDTFVYDVRLDKMLLLPTARVSEVIGRVTTESFARLLETMREFYPWS